MKSTWFFGGSTFPFSCKKQKKTKRKLQRMRERVFVCGHESLTFSGRVKERQCAHLSPLSSLKFCLYAEEEQIYKLRKISQLDHRLIRELLSGCPVGAIGPRVCERYFLLFSFTLHSACTQGHKESTVQLPFLSLVLPSPTLLVYV